MFCIPNDYLLLQYKRFGGKVYSSDSLLETVTFANSLFERGIPGRSF